MNHFIKHNHTTHTQSFLAEAQGLELLQQWVDKTQAQIKLPKVIEVSEQQLILTHINATHPTPSLQQQLGKELAKLHSAEHSFCGLENDNFIGLNPQKNCISHNWGEFFWQYRLKCQVELIEDSPIQQRFSDILHSAQVNLTDWLNQNCKHFSLLHGDLWSGNVMFDQAHVWLIDPAVYFGDSEADIAITELFGGFSQTFYAAYQSIKPLSPVYPVKRNIYNLYHYLNHYNLFGISYLSACQRAFSTIQQDFT